MKNVVNFTNLELISDLVDKIDKLQKDISDIKNELKPKLDLSKRSSVKKFLNISDSTISRWMDIGKLKENIHYIKEFKGNKPKITFIESAIIGLRKDKKDDFL